MGLAKAIQDGVEVAVKTYATDVSASLCAALMPIALTGVTIYLIVIGWAIARGEVQNSISTLTWKVFKIGLIGAIALGGGAYQASVIDGISGIEGVFTNAMGGKPGIGELIDDSILPMQAITGELFKRANASLIPNVSLWTAGILCTFGQVLVTIASLIPLLVAKVMVALLLAIGPVFVLLALWPATQRFTEAWLTATLSSVMTVAVIAAVVGFLPRFMNAYAARLLSDIRTTNVLQDVIGLLIVIVVLAWIAWKASEFGASIVGGASMGNPAQTIVQTLLNRLAFRQKKTDKDEPKRPNSITR
jgi:type IV secretion system protein VirB6